LKFRSPSLPPAHCPAADSQRLLCFPILCLLALTLGVGSLRAQTSPDWQPLNLILQEASLATGADIELVVLHQGQQVYRRRTGFWGDDSFLPIASASKWLAGATILSIVDEGLLDLDDPAGLYLHYFRGDKASITLRHLLTHTSGLGGDLPCLFEPQRSLDFCARQIAASPLLFPPGEAFFYNDASLQVAARIAEVVTGKAWNELFRERIALPLGMQRSTFNADGRTDNPRVASGVVSTTDEYLAFLRMVRLRGLHDGQRILSEHLVELMLADQTAGAPIVSTPYSADEFWKPGASGNRYGFANWIEGMDDGISQVNSSQGAFGVSPYLDRHRDLVFLVFMRNGGSGSGFARYYYQIQDFLNERFPLPAAVPPPAFSLRSTPTSSGLRSWFEYVPAACQQGPVRCAAWIVAHPNGSNGAAFADAVGLRQLANRRRFILVMPNGIDPSAPFAQVLPTPQQLLTWDLAPVETDGLVRDDASFLFSLSSILRALPRVDPERLYVAGLREGADLAQRLVCRSPESFAALAAIRPTLPQPDAGLGSSSANACQPREAIASFFFDLPPFPPAGNEAESQDGEADNNPDDNDEGVEDPASQPLSSADFWARHNRCSVNSLSIPSDPATFLVEDHSGCWPGSPVREIRVQGGWNPTPENQARLWELAWEFTRAHRRGLLTEGRFVVTSAASYRRRLTAPGALVSLFGINIAPATSFAPSLPLPQSLEDVRVELRDQFGSTRNAGLILVSPLQINLAVPEDLAPGVLSVFVYRGLDLSHRDWLVADETAPALFAADASGEGAPAGEVLVVSPDGSRTRHPLAEPPAAPGSSGLPGSVRLPGDGGELYLSLFGTGWRGSQPEAPTELWIGDRKFSPDFSGPQGQFDGLDQINLRLDDKHLTPGLYPVWVRSGGRSSNRLHIQIEVAPDD
jgi:serine-type D-Ala-D-Ala carboxypeptidase/endopeptidase